ncbi:response regulator [Pseudanabaena sp. Chao 1811]|uniref:response regulator n=1 Tax=Pseudanabaena sp. Chao 1811 TaxID=2963092 RepID=UPI0022F3DF87|nr:response regulator [Pseudanabaena sp. Chao 1811]
MSNISPDKTVLVIDDEDLIRQIVAICLENLSNWKPITATSGKDGLNAIAKNKPDAILLDVMMPDMDGFTFVKKLQENAEYKNIPVVLLTSCTNLISHPDLVNLGCRGVISKPFELNTLVPQVADILGW